MKIEIIPADKKFEPLLDLYKPLPANKFLPEWYKKMGRGDLLDSELADTAEENVTAKKCPAIQDMLTEGFILPMWGNFFFKSIYDEEGNIVNQKWNISTAKAYGENADAMIGLHTYHQTKGWNVGRTIDGTLLKIACPWKFLVPKGYSLLYIDPFYHFRDDIRLLSGLVEADKWGLITFPFEFINNDKFMIEAGSPMVQVIPIKREKLEIVSRYGTDEEYIHTEHILKQYHTSQKTYKYYDYS